MELLITLAYIVLIRLVFFDWKLLKFNAAWGIVLAGIWSGAVLTEVVMLGQYTPYTKQMFVSSYVLQIAPEFGGIVHEVYVEPNQPIKKGDPLFQMDPVPWQEKVAELQPQVDLAERHYRDALALVRAEVSRDVSLQRRRDELAQVKAELAKAQYNLDNATLRAPEDGYVINLQLRPGVFIRLKQPVITFVSTEGLYVVGIIRQRGSQWVGEGDSAEIALEMYPGQVFRAKVVSILWGSGEAQFLPSGVMPRLEDLHASEQFAVRLELEEPLPDRPLRFGAAGIAAIYTSHAADAFILLRRLELQSESFLNYLYNPFG
jgi:multidrug resistance efflux pump